MVGARRPAIFFDFDGTLSNIVDEPGAATLVPGADKALKSLAALYPVAVLSGRGLEDIRDRVGIPGLWYAGSHGFEIVGPDGSYHHNETAAQAVPILAESAAELRDRLGTIPGVVVEHKRYAVAVHYRNAAPGTAAAVTAAVHDIGNRNGLKVTAGRKVVELRPNLDWDKGQNPGVDRRPGHRRGAAAAIFIGDDLTDEDGFDAVLHDGIGIVVRHTEDGDRATGARFCLDDPNHVRTFIEASGHPMRHRPPDHGQPWSFTFGGYIPNRSGCARRCAPWATATVPPAVAHRGRRRAEPLPRAPMPRACTTG